MEFALGALLGVAVFAAALITADSPRARRRRPWLDEAMRTRLLVNTRDGQTIEGSLARIDADGIVLDPARYENERLAGAVWIPRTQVAWVQQPPISERSP